jgi:hypothetical protein
LVPWSFIGEPVFSGFCNFFQVFSPPPPMKLNRKVTEAQMNSDFTTKARRREETRLTGANRANRVLPSPLSQLPHVELSGERPALDLSPRGRRKSAAGAILRPFQFFSSAEKHLNG